jgi:hypothetical protein
MLFSSQYFDQSGRHMTANDIRLIIARYRRVFASYAVPEAGYPEGQQIDETKKKLAHCLWLLGEAEEFIESGQIDNARHLVGFIQGCLWSMNMSSLDELDKDNSPVPCCRID